MSWPAVTAGRTVVSVGHLVSVNVGLPRPVGHAAIGSSAITKHPTAGKVLVSPPTDGAGSGLAGDDVADRRHHGGDDQAVYAYAREDLDRWAAELGRTLPDGVFGENLTTAAIDVTGALIGERWRIGPDLVLEVRLPRIPCRTFAGHLGEPDWIRRFTQAAVPGAYLGVLHPGEISQGDPITVVYRPSHSVSIGMTFRALTLDDNLLPELLAAPSLPSKARERAERRLASAAPVLD